MTKDFLIEVREVWEIYPIQLDNLVNHYYAGGNLKNLKVEISEMIKRKKEPKRDLKTEVEKAERNNWMFEF